MWTAGVPITFTVTNTPQALTTTVGSVKAIRLIQHWDNTNRIMFGTPAMDLTTTPVTGVTGWIGPNGQSQAWRDIVEPDAMNGLNAKDIKVAGTANEVLLWAYIQQ